MNRVNWEPEIITFCCNFCSYVASDTAGTRKMQYPTNVKLIRLPCSGRCDPLYILTAFKAGADGVLVTGCRLEQCHFKEGNYKAVDRVKFLKMILDEIGFGGERLHLQFMSAGEPDEFVKAVVDMTDRIKRLGPSPKKELES